MYHNLFIHVIIYRFCFLPFCYYEQCCFGHLYVLAHDLARACTCVGVEFLVAKYNHV